MAASEAADERELVRLQTEATDGFLSTSGDLQAKHGHAALMISNVLTWFANEAGDKEKALVCALSERSAADALKSVLGERVSAEVRANIEESLADWEKSPQAQSPELGALAKKLGQAGIAASQAKGKQGCSLLFLAVFVGVIAW